MSQPTLISPYGYDASTCGYCTPSGSRSAKPSSKKYAFEGSQMSVQFYQEIIDRGWRRSGDFVYHPDIARSCCPQYTIRLDAREFKPNKRHRQVMNRWNRFLSTGSKDGEGSGVAPGQKAAKAGKGKRKDDGTWWDDLHRFEVGMGHEAVNRFETELTPAIATPETFELYKRYQVAVHQDRPEKVNMRGFKRFLCDSPLISQPIQYSKDVDTKGLPDKYGSYHLSQVFKVNGKTIGISVIDILPTCVSSVYFIWDPDWTWASLGKLSALYEASLARRINEAGGGGGYVYMGYWIAKCQKMRYKSDYSPSFLLDPDTHVFHPLTPGLDQYLQSHPEGYHPFANIPADYKAPTAGAAVPIPPDATMGEDGEDEEEVDGGSMGSFPSPPPPGFGSPADMTDTIIDRTLVLYGGARGSLVQLNELRFRDTARVKQSVRELYAALGPDLIAVAGKGMAGVKDRGVLTFG